MRIQVPGGSMSVSREFVAGERMPKDLSYSEFDDWHMVQRKAGLRQKMCGHCCRWWYPADIAKTSSDKLPDRYGRPRDVESVTCIDCAAQESGN